MYLNLKSLEIEVGGLPFELEPIKFAITHEYVNGDNVGTYKLLNFLEMKIVYIRIPEFETHNMGHIMSPVFWESPSKRICYSDDKQVSV